MTLAPLSEPWSCSSQPNLLAATGQRRYAIKEMQAGCRVPHVSPLETWGFHLYSVTPILCHPERSRRTLRLLGSEEEVQAGCRVPHVSPLETWGFHLYSVTPILCHPERS